MSERLVNRPPGNTGTEKHDRGCVDFLYRLYRRFTHGNQIICSGKSAGFVIAGVVSRSSSQAAHSSYRSFLYRCSPEAESIKVVLQVQGPGNEREAIYAFDALLADCQAFRLLTVREIAFDDTAISFPTTDTTGAASFVPLTHGALLYVAREISLVMMLASQQPTQKSVCRSASSTNLRMARSRGRACTLRRIPCASRQGLIGYLTLSQ